MYNRLFRGDKYRAPNVVRDPRAESRGLLGALGLQAPPLWMYREALNGRHIST
jgi:hypothetical protein